LLHSHLSYVEILYHCFLLKRIFFACMNATSCSIAPSLALLACFHGPISTRMS
jgi:hypothetical protein